ncbi:MAG: hypothetical protein M3O68_00930 [Thermoproteota archaeon]|nr:hypothetical protein [Thermoproteota archaeon]
MINKIQNEATNAFSISLMILLFASIFNANNIYGHTISGDEEQVTVEKVEN